jgi:retinol dehydrogenase 12
VYIAVRNEEKANAAIKELKAQTGKEAIFLKLDLADLKSVKASAEEFIRYLVRLVKICAIRP